MKPRRPRLLAAAALCAATLALAGCVYLRLLAMKRQLADFDRHFTLQQTDGLRLLCRDPVLLSDDFTWMGVTPETKRTLGVAEQWRVRWQKQLPAGVRDPEPRDLELELMFADGRFTQVFMNERYFVFVPKSFFIGLLRGLGSASVDRAKREAEVSFTVAERAQLVARVTTASLESLLGHPTERSHDGDQTTFRYRYDTLPLGAKGGYIDMRFTFETATGRLLRLFGRSPVGQLSFNFVPPRPEP
ncbi:MAG: hypothetical protein HZA93_04535 [Verrucomicrobia bacterium]|nr:hypothetical protein [Verrucomicrobiota bacterium]